MAAGRQGCSPVIRGAVVPNLSHSFSIRLLVPCACNRSLFQRYSLEIQSKLPYGGQPREAKKCRGGGRMLVVSFRGPNYGFWSHLGCSGRNADIVVAEGTGRVIQTSNIVKGEKITEL